MRAPREARALRIDPIKRSVEAVTITDLPSIQALIGGHVEAAWVYPTGDVLYVDEDGLGKYAQGFLLSDRMDQLLMGPGLVVGCEREHEDIEHGFEMLDVSFPVEWLVPRVAFATVST